MTEEKEKALAEAFKTIEKQYGKGAVMKLGERVNEKIGWNAGSSNCFFYFAVVKFNRKWC